MSAASRGFIMIALAFPVYLLWKGELPAYLGLVRFQQTAQAGTGAAAAAALPSVTGIPGAAQLPGLVIPPM